jgi:NAD(P)H-quinone oxidoreductase subunit 2
MRPLQVGIVLALVTTSLAGILSNPLFTLVNTAVQQTPMLQSALKTAQSSDRGDRLAAVVPEQPAPKS